MEGYRVVTMDEMCDQADIFVTATGNLRVITHDHMLRMKNQAIVCNIGHFDSEIDIASRKEVSVGEHQAASGSRHFPHRPPHHRAGKGTSGEPWLRHRPPSFVMSSSFTNQVLAQMELWQNGASYQKNVYVLPKHLDEKVARLHLGKLGVRLTELTEEQANYLNLDKNGPYKPGLYRY